MGLDGTVYCRCYEDGLLRGDSPTSFHVQPSGQLEPLTSDVEQAIKFDTWRLYACAHRDGVYLHKRLGNMSGIAVVREVLQRTSAFPVLLERVVYSGIHGGDRLELDLVRLVDKELDGIFDLAFATDNESSVVLEFGRAMRALVSAALALARPIEF